ncbi:hypothetical protein AQ616_09375 [Oceanobacillus sp. E9]|uniref:hypothetical protein n=1 Tax=Oceanobacillus sp. E9 TaxID=1742575 RepID=UPI00084EBE51|nr:hypothetical protein [Oceanobacillus sp. E9]OEH55242.1 hypothetical protein AQ616_09375 [Oceanobacillus sp. E9]
MNTDLQFVHKENYGLAMELVKKFVSKHEARALLQYSLHKSNGDLLATDSHRAIQFYNIHGYSEDLLINPKNLMAAHGEYPDIEKIINNDEQFESIKLNNQQVKIWLQIFKSFNQLMKTMRVHNKVIRFSFLDEKMVAESNELNLALSLPYEDYSKPEIDGIAFNVEYMRDALEVFAKMNTDEITFYFKTSMTPFVMESKDVVKVVILPVRTY